MTREEAIEILRNYDDLVWQEVNKVTMGMVADAVRMGEDALQSPWKSVKDELLKGGHEMKTIEERAEEIFENYPHPYEMPDTDDAYFDGYQVCDMMVTIATDQQKIDTERVCKWICANCECSEACEFASPATCPTIKSITKAMEGEE